jgi:hypothetical protein
MSTGGSTDFYRDVLGVEVVELDRERVAFRFDRS